MMEALGCNNKDNDDNNHHDHIGNNNNSTSTSSRRKSDKKVYLTVLLVQAMYAGMTLLSKAVFDLGMKPSIFVFYRQAFATVFMAPFAFYFEWGKAPPLPFKTFCMIFILSFFGITLSFNVYGVALDYTTATLASATTNSIPVITFFLAVLFRMEKWKVKTIPGLAKLGGIMICIAGASVLALYKGFSIKPILKLTHEHQRRLLQATAAHDRISANHSSSLSNIWIKGFSLMITANVLFSFWMVMQSHTLKSYPSKLLFTTLSSFVTTLQSFVIAIAIERDPSEWKLGWNLRLLAIAYCGIVVTGVSYYLQAHVIQKKGPVFLAMSTPLSFVITVICSSLFLGEIITSGSILGGILLVGGLYSVLWAKSKEAKAVKTAPSFAAAPDAAKDTQEIIKVPHDVSQGTHGSDHNKISSLPV